jgi:hypothetical protein
MLGSGVGEAAGGTCVGTAVGRVAAGAAGDRAAARPAAAIITNAAAAAARYLWLVGIICVSSRRAPASAPRWRTSSGRRYYRRMSGTVFFETVGDALASFLPPRLRGFRSHRTSRNLKVWYDDETREHYEVQFVSDHALRAAKLKLRAPVLEIGFHTEHAQADRNDGVLTALAEKTWRKALGPQAQAGSFVGHPTPWRRISELWDGDGLDSGETATEAAARLSAYICALEPLRRPR